MLKPSGSLIFGFFVAAPRCQIKPTRTQPQSIPKKNCLPITKGRKAFCSSPTTPRWKAGCPLPDYLKNNWRESTSDQKEIQQGQPAGNLSICPARQFCEPAEHGAVVPSVPSCRQGTLKKGYTQLPPTCIKQGTLYGAEIVNWMECTEQLASWQCRLRPAKS